MGFVDDVASGLDRAVEGAGRLVDSGLEAVADAARAAGAAGVGDLLDDLGDRVASATGGTVDERELGETDDPRELIRGDVSVIGDAAHTLAELADGLAETGSALARIDNPGWSGDAADGFREVYGRQPQLWAQAAQALTSARAALIVWADTVAAAQARAGDAAALWNQAEEKDSPLRAEAQEILRAARAFRDNAATEVAAQLSAATESAPETPPFVERLLADIGDGLQAFDHLRQRAEAGAVTSVADSVGMLRRLNPSDAANLTHPAEYVSGLVDLAVDVVQASTDPAAVASAYLEQARRDPGGMIGGLAVDAATTVATGGAGAAKAGARGAEEIAEAARLSRTVTPEARAAADRGARVAGEQAGPRADQSARETAECADPVATATGEFLLPATDLILPGVLPLTLERRHRSNYRFGRWFGPTWWSTLDLRLMIDDAGVVVFAEDGMLLRFGHPGVDESVRCESGQRRTLARTGGGYRMDDGRLGLSWQFAPEPSLGGIDAALGNLAISAITDRHGNRIRFRWNETGEPTAIEHSGGYRVTVDTVGGRVTAYTVAGVAVRRFGYAGGELAAVTNGLGGNTRFDYDPAGRITGWTDDNGVSLRNSYDSAGRVIAQHGSGGYRVAEFAYAAASDGTGTVTVVTDSLGARRIESFDDDHRPRTSVDPYGAVTRTDFNADRRPVRVVAADGATTAYRYTAHGDVAEIDRPDGARITVAYRGPGRPAEIRQPGGEVWHQEWDERGNLTATVDPDGVRVESRYGDNGALVATNAAGAVTRYETDAAGLPVRIVGPLGETTTIVRDGFGRPVLATDPAGATTAYSWTADGHPATVVHADGVEEHWRYDGEGNLLAHVDRGGSETRWAYGPFDCPVTRTEPDGAVTRFRYDTELRLVEVVNPAGGRWTYRYDLAGRLIAETDFNGVTTRYIRDMVGRVVTTTAPTGAVRESRYDVLGRLTEESASDGSARRFGYDPAGRVIVAEAVCAGDTLWRSEIERSSAGRIRAERGEVAALSFGYDHHGRRVALESSSGARVGWEWDAAGRPAGIRVDGRSLALRHDPVGRPSGWRVGDVAVDRSYDPLGRLVEQRTQAHPTPLLDLGQPRVGDPMALRHDRFGYRVDGMLAEHDVNGVRGPHRRRYETDSVGRVTAVAEGVELERFGYDPLGNIVDEVIDGEPWRRELTGTLLERSGRTRYSYDAAGRLIAAVRSRISRPAARWSYEYDDFDQLVGVRTPDGARWRYTYDAFGRRVAKARVTDDGERDVVRFVWDGTRLVEQLTETAATRWTYHPGTHTPLTQATVPLAGQERVDAEFYAIVTDLVGSPAELLDPDSGTSAGAARSTLWGVVAWDGSASTPLRFPGQYHDDETGLHYNLLRVYDPRTGRYLTPDLLGLAPAPNPATYVANPTRWIDPLGLAPCAPDGSSHGIDRTIVYRVEGAGNQRLWIDAAGNVDIRGRNMLFLTFGDEPRAQQFLAQRLSQGWGDTVIKMFDVPSSYSDALAARSRLEDDADIATVLHVDITKTAVSFGLRSSEFADLLRSIIPGSGR